MGVTSLGGSAGRPHTMTEIYDLSAETVPGLASSNTRGVNAVRSRFLPNFSASNLSFEGTTSAPGFGGNGTVGHSYRALVLQASNCQINIAYPFSGIGSTAWNGSGYIPQSRTYLTASESASGYKLYCKAINYTTYSYIQISVNNFSYGYSAGTWLWFSAAGSFTGTAGTGSTITLYETTSTQSGYYELRHAATL